MMDVGMTRMSASTLVELLGQNRTTAPDKGATLRTRLSTITVFLILASRVFCQENAANRQHLADAVVSVAPNSYLRDIPGDFIGLSQDHDDIAGMLGQRSTGIDVAYRNQLKNLTDAGIGPISLRVECDLMAPDTELPGVNGGSPNLPQSRILEPLRDLAQDINVHYILGVDMASNHPEWAAEEAKRYLAVIPAKVIDAFEIGNEPDSYQYQGWRPRGNYTVNDYLADWARYHDAIVGAVGTSIRFMGPSAAAASYNAATIQHLGTDFKVAIYSQHAYPYGRNKDNPPDMLLQPDASLKTVGGYQRYFTQIHSKGVLYRIGEMNSVSGGGQNGVSDSFQADLWLINTGFSFAQAGFDGFNFHTGRYTRYNLWDVHAVHYPDHTTFDRFVVHAPYYGLLFLARMMGNGVHLLNVSTTTSARVKIWATMDKAGRVHVAIVNSDERNSGTVQVSVPGWTHGTSSLLAAPSYDSASGIRFSGQTFDGSTDGTIQGARQTSGMQAAGGRFLVDVPVTSAVLLDLSQ